MASEYPDVAASRPGGTEWGAASLAFGGVFALMVLPGLLLTYTLDSTGFRGFGRTELRLAAIGGYCGTLIVLGLALFGFIFGVLSIVRARQAGRPIALGFAGVLLNGLNLFMWLGALVAWHFTAWDRL